MFLGLRQIFAKSDLEKWGIELTDDNIIQHMELQRKYKQVTKEMFTNYNNEKIFDKYIENMLED